MVIGGADRRPLAATHRPRPRSSFGPYPATSVIARAEDLDEAMTGRRDASPIVGTDGTDARSAREELDGRDAEQRR